ncbi:MAG: acyltransferase [Oscillospiraceae bacterium]|nr:acyltransferase [Oscillospiraceae bacterium]
MKTYSDLSNRQYNCCQFTKDNTLLCKGAAILVMLFHHLFYAESSWELYFSFFHLGSGKPLIAFIANHGKICVTIFVLLSAYGLTKSYKKSSGNSVYDLSFVVSHIKKLYFLYCPIFIIAIIISLLFAVPSFNDTYSSIGECVRDFFAVAYIIDGRTALNGSAWYISFALTLYLVFPLIYRLVKRFPAIMLIISFCIGIKQISDIPIFIEWQRYLFVVCVGIYLEEKEFFNKIIAVKTSAKILVSAVSCIALFAVRVLKPYTFDAFLALAIIVFCVSCFEKVKYLNSVLIFLGKHSSNMFLIHSLLYVYYLRSFIYGLYYPPLIMTVLVLISLACSIVLDLIKVKLKTVSAHVFKGSEA